MASRAIFIRHAKPKTAGYASDELLPLSEEGIAIQQKQSKRLKSLEIKPIWIYSSPLLRAVETADILSETLDTPVVITPYLGNDFNEEELLALLPHPKTSSTCLFVGHAPILAYFTQLLVGKNFLVGELPKSASLFIEFEEEASFGKGQFIQLLTP